MIAGVCRLELRFPEARSLKDKRQTLSSLMARMRGRYGVSVAEVGDADTWQRATLGVACISSSESVCRRLLEDLVRWTERAGRLEVIEAAIEMR